MRNARWSWLPAACLALFAGCTVVDDLGARRRQPEAAARPDPRDAAMAASHLQTLESVARGRGWRVIDPLAAPQARAS